MGQQQRAQLRATLLGGLVQRRERPLVGGVDAGVKLDEQGGDVNVLGDRTTGQEKNSTKQSRVGSRFQFRSGFFFFFSFLSVFIPRVFLGSQKRPRNANPVVEFPVETSSKWK